MPVLMDKKAEIAPGEGAWIGSKSSQGEFAVVFEDDGETGYFYASNTLDVDVEIYDALHVYDLNDFPDSKLELKIGWSPSGFQAVLMVNQEPTAVFDFIEKRGWCLNNFPPPNESGWSVDGHEWSEDALRFFR